MRISLRSCALFILCVVAVAGCGAAGAGDAGSEQSGLPPRVLKVVYVNDLDVPVDVVGCPDCAERQVLEPGERWHTDLAAGGSDVSFEVAGAKYGCVHFSDTMLEQRSVPEIVVSEYRGCG
jgi:hypothetical protein